MRAREIEPSGRCATRLWAGQKERSSSTNDPMWIIAAQEGVVMAHRDSVQGFFMQPLWPRPSIKFALLDKQ